MEALALPIPPPFDLVPRSAIWPGQKPRNANGTPRSLVSVPASYETAHWPGTTGDWADFHDTSMEARAIHVYSQHAKKPWEYNWIGDTEGHVVEYAGLYQAAHSSGENAIASGYLFLLGIGQRPTQAMILAFRQWRWWMRANARCGLKTLTRRHFEMPGASTACPGPDIGHNNWHASDTTGLLLPWSPAPTGGTIVADQYEISNPAQRILDSRWFGIDAGRVGDARPGDNGQRRVQIPQAVQGPRHTAAEVTITVTSIRVGGFITLWQQGNRPDVAHLNFQAVDCSNTTTVPIVNGGFEMYISGDVHVIIDLVGLWV
jgi:hypothetical protein